MIICTFTWRCAASRRLRLGIPRIRRVALGGGFRSNRGPVLGCVTGRGD